MEQKYNDKIISWIKRPENLVLIILLIAVTIYGIIDDNLGIYIKVYVCLFLFGLLLRGFFYLIDKFLK